MWFKALYDVRRPFSIMYGHVVYVEAESSALATVEASTLAQQREGDGVLERLNLTPATAEQAARHQARVVRQQRWLLNVREGHPNRRGDL